MTPDTCGVIGCGRPAAVAPVLLIYAKAGTAPARMIMGLPLCRECGATRTPEDLLTDESFARISAAIVHQGLMAPKRSLTRVEVIDLSGAEYQSFARRRSAVMASRN